MAAGLLLAVAVLAQGQDPLRTAILSKARHELDSVVLKAGIHVPADADDEAVRAAVYEFAQEEKPAHLPRFKWSGEEMPARAATPSRTRGAGESGGSSGAGGDDETMRKLRLSTTGQLKAMLTELKIEFPAGADKEALRQIALERGALAQFEALHPPDSRRSPRQTDRPGMDQMARMMFSSMDKDRDGVLSRAELADLIESTDAEARARGVPTPPNFFASLDANSDGVINRDEAETYFKLMAQAGGGEGGAGGRAAGGSGGSPGGVDAAAIFASLDRDGDGKLSRSELSPIIEQANQANRAAGKGAGNDDFFGSMDADGSGFVDPAEARAFFEQIGRMAEPEEGAGGSSPKSEL